MQVDIDKANEVLGVWERFHGFVEKYGLRGIFTTLVVLAIFGMMVSLFVNPEGFLKRIEDIQQKTNAERIEQRLKADPEIRSELMTVKNETNADRAYILEAHNGTSNTAGLHFLYMDMTYEEYSLVKYLSISSIFFLTISASFCDIDCKRRRSWSN